MRKTLGATALIESVCFSLRTAWLLFFSFLFGSKLIDCLVISLEAIRVFAVLAKEQKMIGWTLGTRQYCLLAFVDVAQYKDNSNKLSEVKQLHGSNIWKQCLAVFIDN